MSKAASGKNALVSEVVSLSMRIARKYLAPYSHRNSPTKFTQEQLITCLIMKACLNKMYRDIVDLLEVTDIFWPDFRRDQLVEAFRDFGSRERRFGGLVKK